MTHAVSVQRSDDCPPHCSGCGGTQVTVPPLEVWLGRLVRAKRWAWTQSYWWLSDEPEFDLLALMLATLGEKEVV